MRQSPPHVQKSHETSNNSKHNSPEQQQQVRRPAARPPQQQQQQQQPDLATDSAALFDLLNSQYSQEMQTNQGRC